MVVLLFFLASIREVTTDNDATKDEGIINIVSHCCYSPRPLILFIPIIPTNNL